MRIPNYLFRRSSIENLVKLTPVLILVFCIEAPCMHAGTIVFQSANMGIPAQAGLSGYQVGAQYLGARFSLASTANVTDVGGHLFGNGDGSLFAAILQLSAPGALPSGNPFDGTTLATTTFLPPVSSADVSIPLSVTLGPGDYALVFGSGWFGATGSGRMPNNNVDLPPASYFYWNALPWHDGAISQIRFVVYGDLVGTAVPEPDSLLLVGFSLPLIELLTAGWSSQRDTNQTKVTTSALK
jgi:hypothetical protein